MLQYILPSSTDDRSSQDPRCTQIYIYLFLLPIFGPDYYVPRGGYEQQALQHWLVPCMFVSSTTPQVDTRALRSKKIGVHSPTQANTHNSTQLGSARDNASRKQFDNKKITRFELCERGFLLSSPRYFSGPWFSRCAYCYRGCTALTMGGGDCCNNTGTVKNPFHSGKNI